MLYCICFLITAIGLLFLVNFGASKQVNIVLFGVVMTVGNAGYFALYESKNLEEAILANKLCYLIGIFVPLLLFLIMCELCHIRIKNAFVALMLIVQFVIYLSVCSIGYSGMFYKTVEISITDGGTNLIKTYGPMHTAYIITLVLYLLLSMVVALMSVSRKRGVNVTDVGMIVGVDIIAAVIYMVERYIKLDYELLPIVFTIGFFFNIVPIIKNNIFSVENNRELLAEKFSDSAFIVIDKKLKYRGSNDYAKMLYPELIDWKLEQKIPGNGGRFNTFLRQPLLGFVRDGKSDSITGKFNWKDEYFEYVIRKMRINSNRFIGYIMEIRNISEYVGMNSNEKGE